MMSFSYFSQTPFFLISEIFFGLSLTFLLGLGLYFSVALPEIRTHRFNILSFSNDFLKIGISISIFSIVLFSLSQVEVILFESQFIQSNFLLNVKIILLFSDAVCKATIREKIIFIFRV